jgi:hypothetical protein
LDRNDAALRAERHAELLAELTAALETNPLDERLAGQLMLAQYRSGRQADALGTYRQMRDRLIDELGVDPARRCAKSTSRFSAAILVSGPHRRPRPDLDRMPTCRAVLPASSDASAKCSESPRPWLRPPW